VIVFIAHTRLFSLSHSGVLTGMTDDLVKNWYLDVSEAVMKFLAHRLDAETVFMGESNMPKKTDHLVWTAP
jgi:hypothetical protein